MSNLRPTDRGKRRVQGIALLVTACGLALCTVLLAGYALHANTQFNVIRPLETDLDPLLFVPQGWRFFTKDPQSTSVIQFKLEDGQWEQATSRNAELENLFGLVRKSGGQGVEMAHVLKVLPGVAWRKCNRSESHADCLDRTRSGVTIKNSSPRPNICGVIGLIAEKPVPWSWAGLPRDFSMPAVAARAEVQCSAG